MSHMFDLRNTDGETVWTGNDRKEIGKLSLPEGDYHLWKFAGTLPVRVVPARLRVAFQSANKKGPRKAKADGASRATGEPVSGESIA